MIAEYVVDGGNILVVIVLVLLAIALLLYILRR